MTGEELKAHAIDVYGAQWKLRLATDIAVTTGTIDRWVRTDRVPGSVRAFLKEKAHAKD